MNYIQAGDLQQGEQAVADFRNRFPEHELAASIGAKLIRNYEQLELWQAAAGELDLIAAEQPQAERERQALYLAADYYDRSGKPELAIQRFSKLRETLAGAIRYAAGGHVSIVGAISTGRAAGTAALVAGPDNRRA